MERAKVPEVVRNNKTQPPGRRQVASEVSTVHDRRGFESARFGPGRPQVVGARGRHTAEVDVRGGSVTVQCGDPQPTELVPISMKVETSVIDRP